MSSILPMDELNRLDEQIRQRFGYDSLPNDPAIIREVEDWLLDLFVFAYAMGYEVTSDNLSSLPYLSERTASHSGAPSSEEVMKVVDAKIAGKTWRERVEEYFSSGGTGADISRIADTETHRIANTAAFDTAKRYGAKSKTWITMADERVRDTHSYLELETVGIDEDFYTYDGDHAAAPGLFSLPENNIRCRCELLFS